MTSPSKKEQATSDRLVVGYTDPEKGWVAAWNKPVCWGSTELDARRQARRLRNEGRAGIETRLIQYRGK